jgi:hypothetical protein
MTVASPSILDGPTCDHILGFEEGQLFLTLRVNA